MIKPADIFHAKVLIVDDQKANVQLLEQLLRGAGYDAVTSTMDSSQVCTLHLVNRYDLIVLDLQMPGMDGFGVMENLKALDPGGYLPVLVVTAQPQHRLRALKAGARDFVSKPFDVAEVLARVYNLIEVRLLHLETKKLYERVVAEQQASERVLRSLEPGVTVEAVASSPPGVADDPGGLITQGYAELTVLFTDLVGFTRFSEGASARVLVGVLDDLSARAGRPVGLRDAERSRAVGEAWLAAIGLPDQVADHTVRTAQKALDLVEAVGRFNAHSPYQLKVRIGFDTEARPAKRKAMHAL